MELGQCLCHVCYTSVIFALVSGSANICSTLGFIVFNTLHCGQPRYLKSVLTCQSYHCSTRTSDCLSLFMLQACTVLDKWAFRLLDLTVGTVFVLLFILRGLLCQFVLDLRLTVSVGIFTIGCLTVSVKRLSGYQPDSAISWCFMHETSALQKFLITLSCWWHTALFWQVQFCLLLNCSCLFCGDKWAWLTLSELLSNSSINSFFWVKLAVAHIYLAYRYSLSESVVACTESSLNAGIIFDSRSMSFSEHIKVTSKFFIFMYETSSRKTSCISECLDLNS